MTYEINLIVFKIHALPQRVEINEIFCLQKASFLTFKEGMTNFENHANKYEKLTLSELDIHQTFI